MTNFIEKTDITNGKIEYLILAPGANKTNTKIISNEKDNSFTVSVEKKTDFSMVDLNLRTTITPQKEFSVKRLKIKIEDGIIHITANTAEHIIEHEID